MNKECTVIIQHLIFQFVKYHYDKYCNEEGLNKINDIQEVVETLYNQTRKKEMVIFIRKSLKDILGDKYNPIVVESILTEIIDNDNLAKQKIINEIEEFQKQN